MYKKSYKKWRHERQGKTTDKMKVHAFKGKPIRTKISMCKNKGTKLLAALHMKCVAIDSHIKDESENGRYYIERIVSFLTIFESNTSIVSQKWFENKLYSMDEERMNYHRQKFFRESTSFVNTNTKQPMNINKSPKKIIRCKYCY